MCDLSGNHYILVMIDAVFCLRNVRSGHQKVAGSIPVWGSESFSEYRAWRSFISLKIYPSFHVSQTKNSSVIVITIIVTTATQHFERLLAHWQINWSQTDAMVNRTISVDIKFILTYNTYFIINSFWARLLVYNSTLANARLFHSSTRDILPGS